MKHNLWMVLVCIMALLLASCATQTPTVIEETVFDVVNTQAHNTTSVSADEEDALEACGRSMDELWERESYHLVMLNDTHFLKYGEEILTVIYENGQATSQTIFIPEDELFAFWIDGFKNESGYFWEGKQISSVDVDYRENETQISFQVDKEHGTDTYAFSLSSDGKLVTADINGAGVYPYILVLDTPEEEIKAAIEEVKS